MAAALKVTRVSRGLLGTRITVAAKRDAQARFGSFFGDRIFYLDEGYRISLLVRGRDWEVGDRLSMGDLVDAARDWANIPWMWD